MSSATDLLAHLRPCPVVATFDGRDYLIPAMDAVDWIALIDSQGADLYDIFPTLAGPAAVEHVEDALWDQRATTDDVGRVAWEIIAAAADRPWWVTLRLINSAREAWHIIHANNATGMSLAGWLDQVWSNAMAHIDPKKRASWVTQIEAVPKGWEGEINFDDEEQAFLNAMNAVMR